MFIQFFYNRFLTDFLILCFVVLSTISYQIHIIGFYFVLLFEKKMRISSLAVIKFELTERVGIKRSS